MSRPVLNFSPGPAMLPEAVMLQAQAEFMDWQGTGKSIMEIGHRTDDFSALAEHTEQSLRDILNIPDNYCVLFLSGGATQQFSLIPMNLLCGKNAADYIHTGVWSKKAIQTAQGYCQTRLVCSSEKTGHTKIPDYDEWQLHDDSAYVYYVDNETIGGVEFHAVPEVGGVPLVSDMTSSLLSKTIDVSRFGLIFAAAQKNIGPAGLTLVIVDQTLLGEVLEPIPDIFNYHMQAKEKSMLCTPPTYNWYMAGLMFDWVKKQGGIGELEKINQRKANALYQFIDSSDFYRNSVAIECRSRMNVVFSLIEGNLTELFLEQAKSNNLHALKGHRLAGGLRASLYNSMPESGVMQLVEFMREFERTKG